MTLTSKGVHDMEKEQEKPIVRLTEDQVRAHIDLARREMTRKGTVTVYAFTKMLSAFEGWIGARNE